MTLAIFDLDNTLIAGDSDHLWGQFLCEQGLVDSDSFADENERFYRAYQAGKLDIQAYLRFALGPLRGRSPEQLAPLHRQFMREKIQPLILPRGLALIESHRRQGHQLLVITATNHFITRPIVDALGIEELLACEAEIVAGRYTGEPTGIPSYHGGKVLRLQAWLEQRAMPLAGTWFYSDSHNDLPLLEQVDYAIAVDPDPTLRARAAEAGWPVISLRD
ncbi:HAD-IB family hydrolase [Kineobactrum sediminis]|uniref:HAD-IB family hydrolase n=1 Tax=Kineobactrum sediminis TaxID=1905677 RepID=A0A2N5Y579_9GAMM|nr:HAD family hydrolase [Kineobactrum sediminis]PLW83553.1 HAD-IB family hydrolase [Kineobactrum sediminis]